jgi:hypothetical protein
MHVPCFIGLIVFLPQCLFSFIYYFDFGSFFISLNTVYQLEWSFDNFSLNFDAVRDAIAQNAAAGITSEQGNSSGGGPSQPQADTNSLGQNRITDTTRLHDYLAGCGEGNSLNNCLDKNSNTTFTNPERVFCSRIWAHVKTEHPEFANNYSWDNSTTINDSTLRRNIYGLNKNYPGTWP